MAIPLPGELSVGVHRRVAEEGANSWTPEPPWKPRWRSRILAMASISPDACGDQISWWSSLPLCHSTILPVEKLTDLREIPKGLLLHAKLPFWEEHVTCIFIVILSLKK